MKIFYIIFITLIITGCASLRPTIKEINNNPETFFEQAQETGKTVLGPLDYLVNPTSGAGVAVGAVLVFLRTWYKNKKLVSFYRLNVVTKKE